MYIPKPGKAELRPLKIASPREKVVQRAIYQVLSQIYEPMFIASSHGFRPGMSSHSALKMVDQQFKNAPWIVEADFKQCFDRIPHDRLMKILSQNVSCQKTLALIKSALQSGTVDPYRGFQETCQGTPQGSVISPLLANIYLHELDKYIQELMSSEEFNKGKKRAINPEYSKLRRLKSIAKTSEEAKRVRTEIRKVTAFNMKDPNFLRLKYVRYADDFIIAVTGPKKLADRVLTLVTVFCHDQLGLELNKEKTKVTKFSDGIRFLGTVITNRNPKDKPVITVIRGGQIFKSRVTPRLSMHAPIKDTLIQLENKGYFRRAPSGQSKKNINNTSQIKPTALRKLINLDHHDIIISYNGVIRGILNYFSFVDNKKSLGIIVHGLKISCALTFALKYKLRTARKVFKRFGPKLKYAPGPALYIPKTFSRTRLFKVDMPMRPGNIIANAFASKLTGSNLFRTCVICQEGPVEMHHVRTIKELRSRKHLDWFTMQMASINRKQVPLCQRHHRALHLRNLTPQEMVAFKTGLKDLIKRPPEYQS